MLLGAIQALTSSEMFISGEQLLAPDHVRRRWGDWVLSLDHSCFGSTGWDLLSATGIPMAGGACGSEPGRGTPTLPELSTGI